MSGVTTDIEIDAPIEQVWEVVMNPERFGDWVTIHRGVSKISDHPLAEGSTMEQHLHMRGLSFHVTWTLVEVSEPHTAHWEGRGPAHSRAIIHYELDSAGDGRTRFHYTNEFTTPGRSARKCREPVHRRGGVGARGVEVTVAPEDAPRARLTVASPRIAPDTTAQRTVQNPDAWRTNAGN